MLCPYCGNQGLIVKAKIKFNKQIIFIHEKRSCHNCIFHDKLQRGIFLDEIKIIIKGFTLFSYSVKPIFFATKFKKIRRDLRRG